MNNTKPNLPNAKQALNGHVCPKCGQMEMTPLMTEEMRQAVVDLLSYAVRDSFFEGTQHGLDVGKRILNAQGDGEPVTRESTVKESEAKISVLLTKYIEGRL